MAPEQETKLSVSIAADNTIEAALAGSISSAHIDDLKSWVENLKKAILEVSGNGSGKVFILIDISQMGSFDDSSFDVIKDLLVFDKKYVTKTATFGGNTLTVMAQKTLSILSGRDNFKAFKSREEALTWLKS